MASPALAAPCRIKAKAAYITSVTISPVGVTPFELELNKVPVVITPSSTGTAKLQVVAPLRFTVASHSMSKLAVRTSKRTVLLGGRLVLAPGLAPTFLGVKSRSLQVTLPLHGFSLRHRTIAIPCNALTIASKDAYYNAPPAIIPTRRIEHATPDGYIPLYTTTRQTAPLWVKFSVPLTVIARKGMWVRLQLEWKDGSSMQGWVPNRLVEVRMDKPLLVGKLGRGVGGLRGMCGRSHPPSLVKFTIRRNAAIHATAGGPVWAHAGKKIVVQAFALRRSDGWIRIGKIDGRLPPKQCSEHAYMWVHARDIVWPPKSSTRRE